MSRRAAVWLLIVVAAATSWVAGREAERLAAQRSHSDRLLYLPNGKYLKVASLGQAPLLADAIYLWAIQFYSNYEREDRHRYVEHVFGNVIAELDPHYVDAYWLGALILSVEAGSLEGALALLEKGMANNPDQWILPYLAAWECYLGGDPDRALGYFERAAAVPGAPLVARRMQASLLSRIGDLERAWALWTEVLEDPQSDATSRGLAEYKLRGLKVQIDLFNLEQAVAKFRNDNGRFPRNLEELGARGYIEAVPRAPDGRAYGYDRQTGRLLSPTGRVLGDS